MQEDPRVIRTKQLIVDSFLALLLEKDFHAISIKDITEQATVNRSTFYRHFTDKYTLLDHVVCQMMEEKVFHPIEKHLQLNEEALQLITFSFCDLVEHLQETFGRNYQTIISLTENKLKNILIDAVQPYFQSQNEESNYFNAMMFVTSIYSASCAWVSEESNMSREQFLQTILPFLLGAIQKVKESAF